MNITAIHSEHARLRPDQAAIEDGARIVTYGELEAVTNAFAANLQAAGIAPGDRVAVMLPDTADHLITLCALARLGAVIYSLVPGATEPGIANSLKSMSVKAVVADQDHPALAAIGRLSVADLSGPPALPFVPPDMVGDDPVMLVQTSATTGAPKFFTRSHGQSAEWSRSYAACQELTPADRCISLVGMSFHAGLSMNFTMLHAGGTVVVPRYRNLDEFVAQVRDARITYLKLTPAYLGALLEHAAGKGLLFPGLRLLSVTTAPVANAQRRLARERLTPDIREMFGTNETGLLLTARPADQDAHPEAIGRAVDGIEAVVVDADDTPLPAGEVGYLRFRGPGFTDAYLNAPEEGRRAFRDGWFYPGDLAAMNDAGYVFFKGRADDIINNAGVKFYPIEVETVLLAHPEVVEAAVFGWPPPPHGEVAVACLVTRSALTARDLRQFSARRMAAHKIPHAFLLVPEMPKNPMGKILKSRLKQEFRQQINERLR